MIVKGTVNLQVSPLWIQDQTRRVVLDCETDRDPATINLPLIADVLAINAPLVTFVINDISDNASRNNITLKAQGGDSIDVAGQSAIRITDDGASLVLGIGTDGKWIALESNVAGGGGGAGRPIYATRLAFFGAVDPTALSIYNDTGFGLTFVWLSTGKYGVNITGTTQANLNNFGMMFIGNSNSGTFSFATQPDPATVIEHRDFTGALADVNNGDVTVPFTLEMFAE